MRSADEYRALAAKCRADIAATDDREVRRALERLAEAYERHADVLDGKKLS